MLDEIKKILTPQELERAYALADAMGDNLVVVSVAAVKQVMGAAGLEEYFMRFENSLSNVNSQASIIAISETSVEDALKMLSGIGVSSTNRAAIMCTMLRVPDLGAWDGDTCDNKPDDFLWPVFHAGYSVCDNTWRERKTLLEILRNAGPARPYMKEADSKFYDALPDTFMIYRGCSRSRVKGISWTTDRAIAERFAKGHRGIPVPDAVVASATIDKNAVFTVFTDRNESEVLIDPRKLRRIKIENYSNAEPAEE